MVENSVIRMVDFPSVWEDKYPSSLFDIVIRYCLDHLEILFDCDCDRTHEYKLKGDIVLHQEICHRMLELAIKNSSGVQQVLHLFKDPIRTRLTRVNLNDISDITDDEIEILSHHPINDLRLYNCQGLTSKSLTYINEMKSTLVSLEIGKTNVLNPDFIDPPEQQLKPDFEEAYRKLTLRSYLIQIPKLIRLGLEKNIGQKQFQGFESFIQLMPFLTHLDLSRCDSIGDLSCLMNNKKLVSLILFNVRNVHLCFPIIQTLKSLRHLDISSVAERHAIFDNPNVLLKNLVENLENLESLDISGTNLAGDKVQDEAALDVWTIGPKLREAREEQNLSELRVTDIPGLISRVQRPLEYLGLYNTAHNACYRYHVPAKRIAGEANEDQILLAAQMNVHRVEVMQKILNDLFHIFRFSTCTDIKLALDVVIHAMTMHMSEKHIQISGSASLFYIVKGEDKDKFHPKIKRKIIKLLLDAMFIHIEDVTMLRNGCLSLIYFKIPDDMFFEYERLVNLLLIIVAARDQDEFVQRVAVYLLNTLACQVDNSQKLFVGDAGAINIMVQLIRQRLAIQTCDEVMETAWSTMWNVTDETPINCRRFLDENGMILFLGCLEAFPDRAELLRNMMGLLGNVAEVKELRPLLMENEYISVFSKLLNSKCDGIEVSYNAAGILSHIASDGPELWEKHISTVKREDVLNNMVKAIRSWKLETKRNINYRSFEPILRLVNISETPEAQLWAVWALANLTKVYPDKYCTLLKEEGGLEMLQKLDHHYNNDIRNLAYITLTHYYKSKDTSVEAMVSQDDDDLVPFHAM